MARWEILLILALVVIANARQTLSAPIDSRVSGNGYDDETTTNDPYERRWPNTDRATTGAATQDGDFSRLVVSPATGSHNNYIVSVNEYQQILDYLQAEVEVSVASDPRNYVPDTVSMDEILRMIEGSPAATLVTETTTTTTRSNNESPVTAEIIDTQANNRADLNANSGRPLTMLTTVQPEVARHESQCSICRMAERQNDFVTLFCGHEYHINCIRNWRFMTSAVDRIGCPMCQIQSSSSNTRPDSSNIEITTETTSNASVVETGDGETKPNEDCSICLDQMDKFGDVAILLCGHKFHLHCIQKWKYMVSDDLQRCPICRNNSLYYARLGPCST